MVRKINAFGANSGKTPISKSFEMRSKEWRGAGMTQHGKPEKRWCRWYFCNCLGFGSYAFRASFSDILDSVFLRIERNAPQREHSLPLSVLTPPISMPVNLCFQSSAQMPSLLGSFPWFLTCIPCSSWYPSLPSMNPSKHPSCILASSLFPLCTTFENVDTRAPILCQELQKP